MEAAFCNTLIVSSDCPSGPKEFLSNGKGGFIFKNDSEVSLINSLESAIRCKSTIKKEKMINAKKNLKLYTFFNHYISLSSQLWKKKFFSFLPNFKPGGAGKSIYNLCKHLNKKKYDLFVISLGKNYYSKEFKKHGVKVFELGVRRTLLAFPSILKIISLYSTKNTLFISNINYANVLSVIFLKILNSYKVALIERTPLAELDTFYNFKDFLKKKFIKLLMFFIYKKADLVISNSKYGCKTLSKYTRSRGEFIYPLLENKRGYKKKMIKKKSFKFWLLEDFLEKRELIFW